MLEEARDRFPENPEVLFFFAEVIIALLLAVTARCINTRADLAPPLCLSSARRSPGPRTIHCSM